MYPNKNKSLLIIALFIFLVIGIGGIYFHKQNKTGNRNKITPTNNLTPQNTSSPTLMANNCPPKFAFFYDEYFSACIPEDFKLKDLHKKNPSDENDKTYVEALFNYEDLNLRIISDFQGGWTGHPSCPYTTEDATLSNYTAKRYTTKTVLNKACGPISTIDTVLNSETKYGLTLSDYEPYTGQEIEITIYKQIEQSLQINIY